MGRWLTPDWSAKPEPVPYANLHDPQSLNLYAYVNNNPLSKADRDGHCDWCQRVLNKLSGNGWKTDEQVAQKGVNNNVVLVKTSMVDGPKGGDLSGVYHVTWTPTKIKNGELQGPVSKNPKDPNIKVSLWESIGGGSYQNMIHNLDQTPVRDTTIFQQEWEYFLLRRISTGVLMVRGYNS